MVEWEAHVEEAVNSTASPDIHSRCWLDLVEPGPAALGVGFSCLFLQVWCLMLIPPHVPWVLSKHAGAGDSAGKAAPPPAHPPACLPLFLPPLVAHPPASAAILWRATTLLILTCHQSSYAESLPTWKSTSFKERFSPFIPLFPFLQTSVSSWLWTLLTRGYVHTAPPWALVLCCSLGKTSCYSCNSIVLSGDVGHIKLVIFQGWSVLGQCAIGEC